MDIIRTGIAATEQTERALDTQTDQDGSARPPSVPLRRLPTLVKLAFTRPDHFLDTLHDQYGPVCTVGAGPLRTVVVGDPAIVAELFSMPTDRFRWNHRFNWFASIVGERSMLTNDDPEHKRLRSAVQAGFSRRRLNSWVEMIVAHTDTAIDDVLARATSEEIVDLYPVGRALTLSVVTRALFGERLTDRVDELGALLQNAQDYVAAPRPPHPFPVGRQHRVRRDRRALDEIIDAEIAHHRRSPSGDPLNVLEALVAAGELSDEEMRDQVVTLIAAGFDTTAASLAWVLWRATLTPHLWADLGAEADRVLGSPGGDGTGHDDTALRRLELADSVMRETLRLHPAGALTPREAAVDLVVGGYRIPRGSMVAWSAYLVGRDADAWPDPLRFDPNRHHDLTPAQAAATRAGWVPFGGGARNCIGFALAQMELTLIPARVAQRLALTPTRSTIPEPVGMVVSRPECGVPMRVEPRVR